MEGTVTSEKAFRTNARTQGDDNVNDATANLKTRLARGLTSGKSNKSGFYGNYVTHFDRHSSQRRFRMSVLDVQVKFLPLHIRIFT